MTKKQTDFTFDEAKKVATNHISIIASFMEDMSDNFPKAVPFDWALLLRQLELKVSQSMSPCLGIYDIKQVEDLAIQLIHANPDTEKQLERFWSLYSQVFNILKSNQKQGYAPQGIIDDQLDRIRKGDKLAENLILNADHSTFAFPLALLLAHIVRTETISNSIRKQLCDVIDKFEPLGLTGFSKDDVEFMCSVHLTYCKGKTVRSDVRVIRNSIAHALFSTRQIGKEYEIEFNNVDFQYHEVLSIKEIGKFFDLHTMLYKRQLTLFFIIELLPLLSTHFLKKPVAS
jgi:hypothetical protein